MPVITVENAVDDICAGLNSAVDLSSLPLLASPALPGEDAVLRDFISGTAAIPDLLPTARIMWTPGPFRIAQSSGSPVQGTQVRIEIYLLYYYGNPATEPIDPQFNRNRNRHVRLLQNYLQLKLMGNTVGISFSQNKWYYDATVPVVVDNDTPFKYLNESIILSEGFSCTRVDRFLLANWV